MAGPKQLKLILKRLSYVLRNNLELNGPKYGCGLEQCGSCMVLLEGKAFPSCRIAVARVKDYEITTLEGLQKEDGSLHPLQKFFLYRTGGTMRILPERSDYLSSFPFE